jgi:acyl carrier protein
MTDIGTTVRPDTVTPDPLTVVREALAVICERPAGEITPATTLDDLGADSLARVELAEMVEEQFGASAPGLHIADDDLAAFTTVDDVASYLRSRL